MKKLFFTLLTISSILLFFQKAHATTEPLVRFTLDRSLYEGLSASQKNLLIHKTQELTNFIETNIKSKIPAWVVKNLTALKIKVLLTDLPGRDGLFTPHESGEHVISLQLIQLQSNGIKALLAHEVYHAIHFHLNPGEFPWVREGMAQLFEFIMTGELNGMNLRAAINDPFTPLLGDYSPEFTTRSQYGHNQLYFYYLYSHCGGDELFWKLTSGKSENGPKGSFLIDAVLQDMNLPVGECSDFSESAVTFEVAKLHNQLQFLNNKEKDKYFIFSSDISPVFPKVKSKDDLKNVIGKMPVLSSFKLAMEDYINFKGNCQNCAIFYASTVFPFTVSELAPKKTKDVDVVLVKIQKD